MQWEWAVRAGWEVCVCLNPVCVREADPGAAAPVQAECGSPATGGRDTRDPALPTQGPSFWSAGRGREEAVVPV